MIECRNTCEGRIWDMVYSRVVGDELAPVTAERLREGSPELIFDRAEYIADLAVFEFQKRCDRWNAAGHPAFKPAPPDEQSPGSAAGP